MSEVILALVFALASSVLVTLPVAFFDTGSPHSMIGHFAAARGIPANWATLAVGLFPATAFGWLAIRLWRGSNPASALTVLGLAVLSSQLYWMNHSPWHDTHSLIRTVEVSLFSLLTPTCAIVFSAFLGLLAYELLLQAEGSHLDAAFDLVDDPAMKRLARRQRRASS